MTIHHDKLAYGRLKSLNKQMSDEDVKSMLDELNGGESEEEEKTVEKNGEKEEE